MKEEEFEDVSRVRYGGYGADGMTESSFRPPFGSWVNRTVAASHYRQGAFFGKRMILRSKNGGLIWDSPRSLCVTS